MQHFDRSPGVAGRKPRVMGQRSTCIRADENAASDERSQADVHSALTYDDDHRADVDASMRGRRVRGRGPQAHILQLDEKLGG